MTVETKTAWAFLSNDMDQHKYHLRSSADVLRRVSPKELSVSNEGWRARPAGYCAAVPDAGIFGLAHKKRRNHRKHFGHFVDRKRSQSLPTSRLIGWENREFEPSNFRQSPEAILVNFQRLNLRFQGRPRYAQLSRSPDGSKHASTACL